MPVRKRRATTTTSSPSTGNDEGEIGEAMVKENSRHSSPSPDHTTDRGWWKRRRREGAVSFTIGRRDPLNLDPLTDEGETEKDQSYNEDEDAGRGEGSSDAFEAQSESSTSLISIGDDGEYGDNSDLHEEEGYEDKSEADEEEEDDDDYEEEPPYDYQDDHGDGSEVDGDERYARLLQQQEIALARSYLQDGFLGQELVAAMAAASEDSSIDMSYEALLELEENLGEVKRRGLEEHTLQGLPRQLHGQGSDLVGRGRGGGEGEGVRERARQCAVCLLDYVLGDELVSLPCTHRFHSECAIQWLRQRATCPVCREVVPDAPICIDLS